MYSKERKEWRVLFEEGEKIKLSCYPLQMLLTKLKRALSRDEITMDQALDDVIALCNKYQRAVKNDLALIFDPSNQ